MSTFSLSKKKNKTKSKPPDTCNPPFFWALWQRDSPQYQALSVPEHSQPGTVVGNVTGAVDADEGSNAIVYYFIAGGCRAAGGRTALCPHVPCQEFPSLPLSPHCLFALVNGRGGVSEGGFTGVPFLCPAGNRESNFQLSREGKLQVLRDLDREKEPCYSIIVKASSQRNWSPPRGQRGGRAQSWDLGGDLTLQEVRIFLDDINDQSPQFTKSEYTAGKECWGDTWGPRSSEENPSGWRGGETQPGPRSPSCLSPSKGLLPTPRWDRS